MEEIENTSAAGGAATCYVLVAPDAEEPGLPVFEFTLAPNQFLTLPLNGYFVAPTAPTTIIVQCLWSGSADLLAAGSPASVLTALQVQ